MFWSVLHLCLLSVFYPNAPVPQSAPDDAKPVVTWLTEKDHDFGSIVQGRAKIFVFKFRNVDADTVLLQTVRTSCGCTAANWTETPVPPGSEGEVRIEYDAYQGGRFR